MAYATTEDPSTPQQIVIVDDASGRAPLIAEALRCNGYSVMTLPAQNNHALQASLCLLRPDFLIIGDEVVIDLKSHENAGMLDTMDIAC